MSSEPPLKKQKKYKVKCNPVWAKDFPVGPCNANPNAFYCLPATNQYLVVTKV